MSSAAKQVAGRADLPNHTRVKLILGDAGVDEFALSADARNALARLDRRQLAVVELVVRAAVFQTARVFLEATADPADELGDVVDADPAVNP